MPPSTEQSKETRMIRLILMLILVWTSIAHAKTESCSWDSEVPCVVISKPNTNLINEKVSPSTVITRDQIKKHNLIDLKSVFKFLNNTIAVQSGPTGQQTSVFMRGTNSNHTLVLLNGIPINDQSTTNGAFDFGQDFLFNVQRIEVYKGAAGAHFGADAIGGAINLITDVDYQNNFSITGHNNSKTIEGNYATEYNGWQFNVKGGLHESETQSALKGGTDLDGTKNKSWTASVVKWFNEKLKFRSNFFTRNTFSDLDGHTLALQNGFDADNNLYAFQTGFDYYTKDSLSYVTLHSHGYDREYNSPGNEFDNYESNAYVLRAEHKKYKDGPFKYGLGFEYKYDVATFTNNGSYNSTLDGDYDNIGLFVNFGYEFDNWATTLNLRTDDNNLIGNNDSYKFGVLRQDILPNLDVSFSHAKGFKNPSLYEMFGADNYGYKGNMDLTAENSILNEVTLDYGIDNSKYSLTLFRNEITNMIEYSYPTYKNNNTDSLDQSGIELSYAYKGDKNNFTIWANSLSSEKGNNSAQLRRPEQSIGFNYERVVTNTWSYYANYNFMGEHFDVHNSNWSTITMPETHLLDIGITKNYYGIDLGLSISNVFDQDYERPHGFSQDGRKINFILKRRF